MTKGNSASSSAAGVTTIGFGQPASSGSSSSSAKTVNVISTTSSSSGFGAPSAGAVAAPVVEVNTLQVKRKKRPLEEEAPAASAKK